VPEDGFYPEEHKYPEGHKQLFQFQRRRDPDALKGTSDKMPARNLFEDIHAQPLPEFHHPLLIGLLGGAAYFS
jgi:hypothetical protein